MNTNKRIRQLAHDTAADFDATLLHNRVYEQVQGAHKMEPELRRLVELSEKCYGLADDREHRHGHTDDVHRAAFDAAEELAHQIDTLVKEAVAEACAVIVTDAPHWSKTWDEEDIRPAVAEAQMWLKTNADVAERVVNMDELEVNA